MNSNRNYYFSKVSYFIYQAGRARFIIKKNRQYKAPYLIPSLDGLVPSHAYNNEMDLNKCVFKFLRVCFRLCEYFSVCTYVHL